MGEPQGEAADPGLGERAAAEPKVAFPCRRDNEVVKREQDLKRDTLHVFRKLQVAETPEEKSDLCAQAVELFDAIEKRVGIGMALVTSGRIVFCNALMECGGLDHLRDCQDSKDP